MASRLVSSESECSSLPFSVIPFKGRQTGKAAPEDKPKNHVRAMPERKHYEIRFPVVEGYAFALRSNLIKADISRMQLLILEPSHTPTAVFVKPQVGIQTGSPHVGDGFEFNEQDREAYYASTHLQTIKFEIARQVVWTLTEGVGDVKARLRLQSRHQLFPQVMRMVEEYVSRKVDFHGCHVRLVNGMTLVLEIKGYEDDQDRAKHQSAQRWISAVNNWGKLGRWQFHLCKDPQMLGRELEWLMRSA